MRQQNTLHRMHMSERLLSSRHEQIKDEIRKLMAASTEVSRQLEELKGQYSTQINDLKVWVCLCACVCVIYMIYIYIYIYTYTYIYTHT